MKKLNKKGFTLIEMLVVIAIIAVLVAIIIPVVTNSTTKAAAAADAANMRSLKSEIATIYLQDQGTANENKNVEVIDSTATLPEGSSIKYPAMKGLESVDKNVIKGAEGSDIGWTITFENNEFTVKYCNHPIYWYATVAETGAAPTD
jgi:prepilin-type N-terminal cleavage/methylation domain-containing protein